MLQNYIKIAWRNLLRQKLYSLVKIGGFAIGIAACIVIALYVQQELTYDQHFKDQERIFRVVRTSTFKGERSHNVYFPAPFAQALQEDFMEFEKVGRYNLTPFFGAGENEIRRSDQQESTHEDGFVYMDQALLDILQPDFISGSPGQALAFPNTIVLTKTKAQRFFPHEDPLGKVFILNNDEKRQYTVSGVVEDPPLTSHLQYHFIMTMSGKEFYDGEQSNWMNSNYPTYVKLQPGADPLLLQKKLSSVVEKYFLPEAIATGEPSAIEWTKSLSFELQPIHEVYLNLDGINDGLSHGDVRYIWLFGGIAMFILIIACINFINLSTARSANRAKEVGLRKVVGSMKRNLIAQFLIESIVLSLISFGAGLLLSVAAVRYFSLLFGKSLSFQLQVWWVLPVLAACAIGIGLIAGLYPAFYLSSFRPSEVLKGNKSLGAKYSGLRSTLVVFQFAVSIVLIVGTLIIGKQMEYVLNKKLGFDKEQVLLLQGTHTLNDRITTFKEELLRIPGVKYATISDYLPGEGARRNQNQFSIEGEPRIMEQTVGAQRWEVDHDYVKTLGLQLLEGRDFSLEMASDSQAFIVNRSMARALNLRDPVGAVITNGYLKLPIIGVIEDFHSESLRENIEPLCLQIGRSVGTIAVKINTSDMSMLISEVSRVWKKFSLHQPIRYTFLDQTYARMYDDVQRMGSIFSSFAILAILVASFGLFALSTFMMEQRNKEISIRLVLGASLNSILRLVTLNYIKLVLIAIVLATPLSIFLMQEWLKEFAYRIDITWQFFVIAGLISLSIALLTISYQSVRAAFTNPVDSLKEQ
ncbi:MAG TPA: ABC transporter permease [Chryseolinea sp.]